MTRSIKAGVFRATSGVVSAVVEVAKVALRVRPQQRREHETNE